MKKTRWRAILKAEGYTKSEEYCNSNNHVLWKKEVNSVETFFMKEEIRKDKNILHWLAFRECPHCEYCLGCGMEWDNGWYHSCCGCEGTGVDTGNIKKIGKLVD